MKRSISELSLTIDEDIDCTLPELIKTEVIETDNSLPYKSRAKYEQVYENFLEWRKQKQTQSFSESVLLTYFKELSATMKPPTLWSIYSMLKKTMNLKHNLNIRSYVKLLAFLKRQSVGYRSKKAKVFSNDEICKFLNEAPDATELANKVILIFGISGACRKGEITDVTVENVKDIGSNTFIVNIPDNKTNQPRTFIIDEDFYAIVKKYQDLRPKNVETNRFFLNYQSGKCTMQPIGKNKIGNIPKKVAQFLQLPNPETYTGHTFRRTSATLLADSGADLNTLRRHGGWTSRTVAKRYVEDSKNKNKQTSRQIRESFVLSSNASTNSAHISISQSEEGENKVYEIADPSTSNVIQIKATDKTLEIPIPDSKTTIQFTNCSNISINFNVYKSKE